MKTRRHRHQWTWKTADGGYHVVCRACGHADRSYKTERGAETRLQQLRKQSRDRAAKIPERDRYAYYGLDRRMREARRAIRKAA